ncbi:uncharacterized protein LOC143628260 [Bidens hawaiensis]|uniref:uncharacterized protein LOC143628260 n=1 Tax=Bidens hawaiensis TaxID=980011 RepID=UPI00404B0496
MSETTNNVLVTPPTQLQEIRPFKCDLCNITCNNKDLLDKHKLGRKHLKNLQKSTGSSANAPKVVPSPAASETLVAELGNKKAGSVCCDLCKVVCNNQEIYQKHVVGKKHSAKVIIQLATASGFLNATSYAVKKPSIFQCELCEITCTSNELLNMHLAGKKHLRKLKESGQIPNTPLTPIASLDTRFAKPMVTPESDEGKTVNLDGNNINGKRVGSYENVESKRQKILQGGAALNAIRACTLCNVVCNSSTVFDAHLRGQKHAAAMAAKQVETSTDEKS